MLYKGQDRVFIVLQWFIIIELRLDLGTRGLKFTSRMNLGSGLRFYEVWCTDIQKAQIFNVFWYLNFLNSDPDCKKLSKPNFYSTRFSDFAVSRSPWTTFIRYFHLHLRSSSSLPRFYLQPPTLTSYFFSGWVGLSAETRMPILYKQERQLNYKKL